MNTADLIYVVTVCMAIFLFGDRSSRFTRFDRGCLVAVMIIVLFWIITRNHHMTNILMQVILVIAYFPVVKRLLDSRENTEPFSVWIGMLACAVNCTDLKQRHPCNDLLCKSYILCQYFIVADAQNRIFETEE